MANIVVIDADIIPYEIGYVMEKDDIRDWPVVKAGVDNRIKAIVEGVSKRHPVHEAILVLSDPDDNFRKEVATILPYKGNRTKPKPYHWDGIRAYLRDLGAVSYRRLEGDDSALIEKAKYNQQGDLVVIASTDKDLDQSPGLRYAWGRGDIQEYWKDQSEIAALRSLWTQMLTGDKQVDNILGIYGLGPKSAEVKALMGVTDHFSASQLVMEAYTKRFGSYARDFFLENLSLLKLVETLNEENYYEDWANRWLAEVSAP